MPFEAHKLYEKYEQDKYKTAIAKKAERVLREAKREGRETAPEVRAFSASFEGNQIEIDTEAAVNVQGDFYEKHIAGFDRGAFEESAREVLARNADDIEKSMQELGFDRLLIVPEDLPPLPVLHEALIPKNDPDWEETWKSSNFQSGGSFQGAVEVKNGFRIILCHGARNLADHPLLASTKGKSITDLSGLTQSAIEANIRNRQPIPLLIEHNGVRVSAEGLSLSEYLILQRQAHDDTHAHLDEIGWTWLPGTFSASRIVYAFWNPESRRLGVLAGDVSGRDEGLGVRPSRSFQ